MKLAQIPMRNQRRSSSFVKNVKKDHTDPFKPIQYTLNNVSRGNQMINKRRKEDFKKEGYETFDIKHKFKEEQEMVNLDPLLIINPHQKTESQELRLSQWNISSMKKNTLQLCKLNSPHIFCLQEIRNYQFENSPNYTYFVVYGPSDRSGGVAIGIHKCFDTTDMKNKVKPLVQKLRLYLFQYKKLNNKYNFIQLLFPQKH